MKSFKEYITEEKGEHDASQVYNDLYKNVEDHLEKWGAGPVYGWKGDNGIAFAVSKGKNVQKDDWIAIIYNRKHDDLTITLSTFGTDDISNAKDYAQQVYAGEECEIIDKMLGI